ncbi:MAG: hypothetical protein K6T65_04265 [Peptococcaceae bacterium]|nr:hypothetical protein [Peptococcaceae bacterium]
MGTSATVSNDYSLPKNQTREVKKTLDQTDFLNLLAAQLKNQDPLDPQSNDEFVATMAQFNSLEAMASMNKTVQYGQAASLIDNLVTVQVSDQETVTGRVEKAGLVDGEVVVYVDGEKYGLSAVKEVRLQEVTATGHDLIQAAAMIGREVLINGEDARLSGIVEKVGLADGTLQVYVNGTPYDISDIVEIGEAGDGEAAGASAGESQDGT